MFVVTLEESPKFAKLTIIIQEVAKKLKNKQSISLIELDEEEY